MAAGECTILSSEMSFAHISMNRCSEHRGFTVPFSSCLNLTRKQFAIQTFARPAVSGQAPAFRPRIGPAPVVPGQHFRPAANGPQPRPAGANGFARPPRPSQNGPLHFGNAAKGVRAPRSTGPRPSSNDPQAKYQILRSVLNGNAAGPAQAKGDFVGGVFQPQAPVHAPKPAASHLVPGQIPQLQPRPFPRPMPAAQNGHPAPGNGHPTHAAEATGQTAGGSARGGRARGRGRGRGVPGGRGRGAPRGRGGHAVTE